MRATASYIVLLLTLAFLPIQATASSNHSNAKHNFGCGWWKQCNSWFIAPQNYASGQSIQGVDPATGILRQSQTDIPPLKSGLALRRFYQSNAFKDSWQHQYSRRLSRGQYLRYYHYQGLKSELYRHARNACRDGWSAIRETAYNGQYSTAQAEYHQDICEIKQSDDIIARLPVHRTRHQHNNRLRTVTRPNGTVYTFVRQNQQWKTLSKAPVQLKRNRNHWVFTDLDGSTEKYSHQGQLLNIINTETQTTTLKYDYFGRLKKVKDQFGKKLTFNYRHYGWGNQLKKVTSPSGTVKYSYDRWDRLSKAKYQDGSTQSYRYQDEQCENCLTEIINAADETEQKISYDQQGRVNSTEGANGSNQRDFSYGNGEVIVSDSAEAETHYQFNLHHGVQKIATLTDATGQSESFGYDQNGYPANHTAKNGNITETEYNERGLLAVSIENAGTDAERETATQWHPDFRKPTERTETNQTTNFDYDNSGRLTQQIQSPNDDKAALRSTNGGQQQEPLEQRITAFAYDELGQITETVSPSGASRTQSYDEQGNRTSTTNALGHQTQTLAFDAAGRALKSQDSNGIITENQYDTAGRLLKTTSNGQSTRYQYDSAGRQTKVTFPDDTFTENQYDGSGRIIKTINQRGDTTENSYDSNGNRTKTQMTDEQGNIVAKIETSYNLLNQAIQITDAEGNSTSFEYDASGNQTKITDAKGNITKNQYDSQNRLTKTIDALGGETSYQYDINGNRTKVIAPNGATTTFSYDNFNQLTTENSPDRGQTQYSYDISGNKIQTTDANSDSKQTQYDDLKRKTQESWVDHPELTINYTYDSCDNGIGKLCQVTDASGHTSYQYNTDGRVTQKDQNIQGITLTQQFSYTEDNKLQSQTYPSGAEIGYSYNEDQLEKISINQETFLQNIQYDAANRITGWQWADNTQYSKSYDHNGRLKTFTLGNSERTLEYDETNNIIGWTDENSDEYKQFGYDALNRINDYSKNRVTTDNTNTTDEILQSQTFSYDANGNRTELIEDGTTSTSYQVLENSNRLIAMDGNPREYDSNGNLINDGEHTYQYGARNRLTSVDGITSNLYNADNQRVKKTNNETNETTLYAWANDRIFAEYDEQGESIQETVYLGNIPIAVIKQENIYRIYTDQIDTPRVITDENNIIIWRWDSKPFGESLTNDDNIAFRYNLRFPGQYYDKEVQTHYNFNRDYNPMIGSYIQSDPIGLSGGLNSYAYVNGSPLTYIDSKGQSFFSGVLTGAEVGGSVCGPYCAVAGAAIGGAIGVVISDVILDSSSDSEDECPSEAPYGPFYRFEKDLKFVSQAYTERVLYGTAAYAVNGIPQIQAFINPIWPKTGNESHAVKFCTSIEPAIATPMVIWYEHMPGVIKHDEYTLKISIHPLKK